jgi:hypothetical protein
MRLYQSGGEAIPGLLPTPVLEGHVNWTEALGPTRPPLGQPSGKAAESRLYVSFHGISRGGILISQAD